MTDIGKVEKQLRARLDELTNRADEVADDMREPLDNDMEEQLTEIDDADVNQSLDDMINKEIIQIRAALTRIEDGSYGTCANCGKDIAEGRLEALPYATNCIDCAP